MKTLKQYVTESKSISDFDDAVSFLKSMGFKEIKKDKEFFLKSKNAYINVVGINFQITGPQIKARKYESLQAIAKHLQKSKTIDSFLADFSLKTNHMGIILSQYVK